MLAGCGTNEAASPSRSHYQVKHCILIANGDVDRATQILLHRQEAGQSLKGTSHNIHAGKPQPAIDEHELKNRIISKQVFSRFLAPRHRTHHTDSLL